MNFGRGKRGGRGRSLRKEVEALKRSKLALEPVINLDEYRELTQLAQPETILVVDDDEMIRKGLSRVLEKEGYKVIVAEDGMELSKILENMVMDLILLDVNLPWVDGYELCSLIKSNDLLKQTPLIFISGDKTEESLKKGFAAGCDDYIGKPFDLGVLLSIVDKTLEARRKA